MHECMHVHTHHRITTLENLKYIIYPASIHWRKPIFTLPACVSWKQLLGLAWMPVSTSPSECWDSIWLGTVQTLWVLRQSLWVHVYINPSKYSWNIVFLMFVINITTCVSKRRMYSVWCAQRRKYNFMGARKSLK